MGGKRKKKDKKKNTHKVSKPAKTKEPKQTDSNSVGWFNRTRNVRILVFLLILSCVGLIAADVFHLYHKHAHEGFDWEMYSGFHALYGFVSFVFIVLAGKGLRKLVMRNEDYYD